MNKRLILAAVAVVAVCGWLIARSFAEQPKPNDVSTLMKLKLKHSQKVLEGIAVEDFDMIAKNSQQLALLAQEANWRVYQTPEYRHHSADFQRIAESLTKAAKERNGDAAALAYVQLTMSCVNCHKYVRGVRMASAR
jgi:cytochrome c556